MRNKEIAKKHVFCCELNVKITINVNKEVIHSYSKRLKSASIILICSLLWNSFSTQISCRSYLFYNIQNTSNYNVYLRFLRIIWLTYFHVVWKRVSLIKGRAIFISFNNVKMGKDEICLFNAKTVSRKGWWELYSETSNL